MTESAVGEARTGKGSILLLACTAQFMVVLDIAIVNVALPSIQADLSVGRSTLRKPSPDMKKARRHESRDPLLRGQLGGMGRSWRGCKLRADARTPAGMRVHFKRQQ